MRPVPVTTRDEAGREFTVMGPCWAVPPERMKGARVHLVPLGPRTVALLGEMQKSRRGAFVFPGQRAGKPLSNMALEMILRRMKIADATVHGFRCMPANDDQLIHFYVTQLVIFSEQAISCLARRERPSTALAYVGRSRFGFRLILA
jgi:hypothetical protein